MELTPKSQRFRGQVSRVDLWISPETGCAAQIPVSELELPKGAKRIKMN